MAESLKEKDREKEMKKGRQGDRKKSIFDISQTLRVTFLEFSYIQMSSHPLHGSQSSNANLQISKLKNK